MVRGPQAGMGLLSWVVAPSWSSGQPEQPLAHLATVNSRSLSSGLEVPPSALPTQPLTSLMADMRTVS